VRRAEAPAKGRWWVPGGRVVKGETLASAAWRKAKMETGIDCVVGPVVHRAELCFPDGPGGKGVHAIATCFLLTPIWDKFDVRIDGTSIDWRWCNDPDDFWADAGEGEPEHIELHEYVRACLKRAGL